MKPVERGLIGAKTMVAAVARGDGSWRGGAGERAEDKEVADGWLMDGGLDG